MKIEKTYVYFECDDDGILHEFECVKYLPKQGQTMWYNERKYYVEEVVHEFFWQEHDVFVYLTEIQ